MGLRITPAVKWLLITCFAMFLVQQTIDGFYGGQLLYWLGLVPSEFMLRHRFWQLFTYAFLHGDVMHLFFNLMMLAFIGGDLEATWGTRKFLQYYFFCAVSAGVVYLVIMLFAGSLAAPMIGASGAIYGLLMAYGLIFGERTMLFMMLFPMKAKHFVWILAAIEFMTSVFSHGGGLAGAAHLGGMAAGFVYLWVAASLSIARKKQNKIMNDLRAMVPQKKKKKSKHLKLIINNKSGKPDESDEEDENPKTWH